MSRFAGLRLADARRKVAAVLVEAGKREAQTEARLLVAHAAGHAPSRLAMEGEREMSAEASDRLAAALDQRLAGRTVGRIIGRRAFHAIELEVADDVLEPRDDTDALVELARPILERAAAESGDARFWDVGTGTGAIALALLAAVPSARALATDRSEAAVRLCLRNAERLDLDRRLQVKLRDALGPDDGERFDLIVSNPPYIPTAEIETLEPEVRRDPSLALDGGSDGLDAYRWLAAGGGRLREGGAMAVEIGAGQGPDVRAVFRRAGWHEIASNRDLGGHERAIAFSPVGPSDTAERGKRPRPD